MGSKLGSTVSIVGRNLAFGEAIIVAKERINVTVNTVSISKNTTTSSVLVILW